MTKKITKMYTNRQRKCLKIGRAGFLQNYYGLYRNSKKKGEDHSFVYITSNTDQFDVKSF